jgi:hypothetical protein
VDTKRGGPNLSIWLLPVRKYFGKGTATKIRLAGHSAFVVVFLRALPLTLVASQKAVRKRRSLLHFLATCFWTCVHWTHLSAARLFILKADFLGHWFAGANPALQLFQNYFACSDFIVFSHTRKQCLRFAPAAHRRKQLVVEFFPRRHK